MRCAICLRKLKKCAGFAVKGTNRKRLKLLECSHRFHEACILKWFGESNTCPVCRAIVDVDDPTEVEWFRYSPGRQHSRNVTLVACAIVFVVFVIALIASLMSVVHPPRTYTLLVTNPW